MTAPSQVKDPFESPFILDEKMLFHHTTPTQSTHDRTVQGQRSKPVHHSEACRFRIQRTRILSNSRNTPVVRRWLLRTWLITLLCTQTGFEQEREHDCTIIRKEMRSLEVACFPRRDHALQQCTFTPGSIKLGRFEITEISCSI